MKPISTLVKGGTVLLFLLGAIGFSFSQTYYTYTGANQSYVVPAGVTCIQVHLWGAGGGGGDNTQSAVTHGGGGGYVTGNLTVTPGETLTIIVGQGGQYGSGASVSTFGGGGRGGGNQYTGSGGGRSAIRRSTTELATAGGGGGGAETRNVSGTNAKGGVGGAGGGTTGRVGGDFGYLAYANNGYGGGGGTQTAGGTKGSNSGYYEGTAGSQFQGGAGNTNSYREGGGGGGGYYGGGGGSGDDGNYGASGGGGGSSYIGGLSSATTTAGGSGALPSNEQQSTPNYTHAYNGSLYGRGGNVNSAGQNGRVVIVAHTVNPGSNVTTCGGSTSLSASSTLTTFSWSPSTGLSNAAIANPVATPSSTTTYTVTATTSGCSASASVTVTVNPLPAPTYTAGNITVGPIRAFDGTPLLPDANLTGSGNYGLDHEEFHGRLFNIGSSVQGWAANGTTPTYWQADLGSVKPVNGVITQGRGDCCPQWVSTYEVQVSVNGTTWTSMGIFNGNTDQQTPVTNLFTSQTTSARYVRIYPVTVSGHTTMRADVISIPPTCASGAQSVSVSASPGTGGNTIRWYAASSGGSPLFTGQYYTPSISSTTTFYASSYNSSSGCESTTRIAVSAQVGVAIGSEPSTVSNLPASCSDFVSALPNGWKTNHQAIVTPSTSTTHDCSGLAASLSAPGHYVWVKYNANATNVKYSLKLDNSVSSRYLLVEQSVDGCTWTPVNVHTNVSVATNLSVVSFTGTLNAASRHVRFNTTRSDGGKIEVDNVVVYNGTAPAIALAPSGSTKICKVYGNHWVDFYTASNELIGSVRANGALDGTTNNLGDVTLTVNVGASGSMFACNTSNNPLYETAYMGRSWTVSSTAYPNSANFASSVSVRFPYANSELTAMNATATATTGNPNDNGASVSNLMLTKISGASVTNFTPTDNCGDGVITGIAQNNNGSLASAYPTITATGSFVDFNVGQFSEMYLNKSFNNSPLPVSLTSFSANCTENMEVRLRWTTASEQNSQKFVIERSRDMNQWISIAEEGAAGNSNFKIDYTTMDPNPYDGISYYRLVQVDNDGVQKIYSPLSVSCSGQLNKMFVYPNPSSGKFTVEIESQENLYNVEIQLMELTGKVILTQKVNVIEGKNHILIEEPNLEMGAYMIRLVTIKNQFTPVKVIVN